MAFMEKDLIFYDGLCGLCNGAVRFILARDRKAGFQFASLQGAAARQRLKLADLPDSLVLLSGGETFVKAGALLKIGKALGFPWNALSAMAGWLPQGILDRAYDFVARHRGTFFRRYESCPLPDPAWKDRFVG